AGGAGGGDETRLAAGQPGDDGTGLALQIVDFDELRQDLRHRLDRFRNNDRGAEAGHGAGDVDYGTQADRGADIVRHGASPKGRHTVIFHRQLCHSNVIASRNRKRSVELDAKTSSAASSGEALETIGKTARRSRVSGIDRALQVIDYLYETEAPAGAYAIAKAIKAPLSTV